jgi:hypothetical protein
MMTMGVWRKARQQNPQQNSVTKVLPCGAGTVIIAAEFVAIGRTS